MRLFGLNGVKQGNKFSIDEFKEIFLEFYPGLCLYASKFVGDINISKDIAQDVLTQFWAENEKLRDKNLTKPYLYKSVKNQSLNYIKREKRKSGLDEILNTNKTEFDLADKSDTISLISLKQLQTDLEDAVKDLPEQRQIIFRMSRFEQMKHKEIAAELKISPKTVETQIYRSLIFLQKRLHHYLNDRYS